MSAFHPIADTPCHYTPRHKPTGSYARFKAKSGPAANDPIADIAAAGHSETMNELDWDERLKRVAKSNPEPEKPE